MTLAPPRESIFSSDIPELDARRDARAIELSNHELYAWTLKQRSPRGVARQVGHGFGARDVAMLGEHLLESVRRAGIVTPLVIYGNALEGHHRLAAAILLGLRLVPIYVGKRLK